MFRTGVKAGDVFRKVDLDKNGVLSYSELERVSRSFQPDLTAEECQLIFACFDEDASGSISIADFCHVIEQSNPRAVVSLEKKARGISQSLSDKGLDFKQAISLFDRDNSGTLSYEEWLRVLRVMDPSLAEDEALNLFRRLDRNGDQAIDITEFESFLEKHEKHEKQGTGHKRSERSERSEPGPKCAPKPSSVPSPGLSSLEEPWEREILNLVRTCLSKARSGMALADVFKRLDLSNSGTLTRFEFDRMVSAYRPDVTKPQLNRLFAIVNKSGTGEISQREFIQRFS